MGGGVGDLPWIMRVGGRALAPAVSCAVMRIMRPVTARMVLKNMLMGL